MKFRVESGLTGQTGNAKGNTPRATIRIDINTHQIVLEITQREERIPHLKVDQPVNIESTIDMMTTTIPDPIRNQPVSVKSKILTEFIKTSNLISMQSVYGSPESTKYNIFVEKSIIELIDSFTIVDEKDIVSSDHRPMLYSITSKLITSSDIQPPSRIAWKRCSPIDTSYYNIQVDRQVQESICYQVRTETAVLRPNYIHELLTDIIHASAAKLPRSKFNKRAKPYWSAEVKAAHTSNRYYWKRWIEDGRPRTRDIQCYIRYKDAKRLDEFIDNIVTTMEIHCLMNLIGQLN